jgi:hypothetical protein
VHWLSWRIGLSPGTARGWVRVARRLAELPTVETAFSAGQVSWSQVGAVIRVAPDDGVDRVELARHSTAAQLEEIVRGVRRAQFPRGPPPTRRPPPGRCAPDTGTTRRATWLSR